MKKVRILGIVGFFLISLTNHAQDYTFRVLANKGANEVKSGDTWQPLKTGAQLKMGDQLKVSDNSSVGLVHKATGRPLEVKQPKTYTIAELDQKINNGGTTVLNKYADFILSSNSADAKKHRLSATGAVHRGLEDIKLYLPGSQNAEIFNNVAIIGWGSTKDIGPFIVSFKNLFDEELAKIETSDTTAQIDFSDAKFANEPRILVEVKSKADSKSKSEQRVIDRIAPASRYEALKKQITDETVDLQDETAFNKYLLAGFYEEKKLLIDANTCYEQAIKMEPDNPTYKEAYAEFLLRNKMK